MPPKVLVQESILTHKHVRVHSCIPYAVSRLSADIAPSLIVGKR